MPVIHFFLKHVSYFTDLLVKEQAKGQQNCLCRGGMKMEVLYRWYQEILQ